MDRRLAGEGGRCAWAMQRAPTIIMSTLRTEGPLLPHLHHRRVRTALAAYAAP